MELPRLFREYFDEKFYVLEGMTFMKKRKLILPVCIVGGILLICIIGLIVLLGIFSARGLGISVGRCLETKGGYMLVVDNSPIKMSNRSGNEDLFADLTNGDEIFVIHDGIAESYPAQTGAYFCLKLKDDGIGAIPEIVIDSLAELGWLSEAAAIKYNLNECDFTAQHVRIGSGDEGVKYPVVKVISSQEEWNDFYQEYKDSAKLESYSQSKRENYFDEQVLIFVILQEISGSIEHRVKSVGVTDDNKLAIFIDAEVEDVMTDDMAAWRFLIEPECDLEDISEEDVIIFRNEERITENSE